MRIPRSLAAVVISSGVALLLTPHSVVRGQARTLAVRSEDAATLRAWDNTVNSMLRTRELERRLERDDTLLPGRTIEQLDQYHQGVRVWGGSVNRQLDGQFAVSVFGTLYADIAMDVTPTIPRDAAKAIIERIGGAELGPDRLPELVILPDDSDAPALAWVGAIATLDDTLQLFVDARTGAVIRRYSLAERQAPEVAIGHGVGVLGDNKKVSAFSMSGTFYAIDPLRPPTLNTYTLQGNLTKVQQFLNGVVGIGLADVATAPSNEWTDAAAVDAHVHSGFTYDYYYKRFGRHGLDNADARIVNIVHPAARADVNTVSESIVSQWYLNAFYAHPGVMVYGDGLPAGFYWVANGKAFKYMSGALDVVGHELTHGVTHYTSGLVYAGESGALAESFSDMMGTSIEFYYQPAGSGPLKADYLMGEDVVTGVAPGALDGVRSMENPGSYGHPDHYSRRVILPLDSAHDNGGVHYNSGIPNQAFYLAIEGGTNRTSGIRVQGIGAANRERIEKVFYRAFAQLMPSNATFSMARAITLQAAQDLYGSGSAAYAAVRDAWLAVGVM